MTKNFPNILLHGELLMHVKVLPKVMPFYLLTQVAAQVAAGIIILTLRVPSRSLLPRQKMTLCRTGRPYKNGGRTGK